MSKVDEILFEVLIEVDVKIVVSMVVICVDDNSTDELSVRLETLFTVVVSSLVINNGPVVSVEVAYEVDVSSMVLNVCILVELETSFIVEMDWPVDSFDWVDEV